MDRLQHHIPRDGNDRYILCRNIDYKSLDSSKSHAISEFIHIGTMQTNRGIPLYALLETITSDPQAAHLSFPDLLVMLLPTLVHAEIVPIQLLALRRRIHCKEHNENH